MSVISQVLFVPVKRTVPDHYKVPIVYTWVYLPLGSHTVDERKV